MLPPAGPDRHAALWLAPPARRRAARSGWATALLALGLLLGCASVVAFVGILVVHSIGAGGGCGGG